MVNNHNEVNQNSLSYHDSGNDLSAELANRIYNPSSIAIMNNQFLAMSLYNSTTVAPPHILVVLRFGSGPVEQNLHTAARSAM